MKSKELLAQMKAARENLKAYKEKRLSASNTGAPASKSGIAMEQKACSRFGVKSLNDLITVNTASRRFAAIPADEREAVKSLKEAVDVTLMVAKRFGIAPQSTKAYEELVQPSLKALGITSGDAGYEWIPTAISTSYIDEYNLERKIAGLFQEVKMPSNPYEYPVLSNGAIATKLGQNSQKSSKDQFASSVITFTAVKISNQYELPEELSEDSAIDVMKVIRQELIEGQEKAMEIAILEGDTAATHQHDNTGIPGATGAPAADSSERFFDGLRKRALAASLTVDCAGAVSEAKLAELRKKLGKFGVQAAELALIVGVTGSTSLTQLPSVITVEKYGPQATVMSGEVAKYQGTPVICSEWLREDCDTTGVNGDGTTNGANVKGTMILVNRKRFFTGLRRGIQVKVENNRTAFDVWDMVSFSRRAFQGVLKADGSNASTEKSVALLHNIT